MAKTHYAVTCAALSLIETLRLLVVAFSTLLLGTAIAYAGPVTVISTVTDLQNISSDLTGSYVLSGNIDASGFDFTPIGQNAPFSGTLDGAGYTISGLTISSADNSVGLFGWLSGVVHNLNLSGVSIEGSGSSFQEIGAVAGYSSGQIFRTQASGNVIGFGNDGVGGLTGDNTGSINFSNSTANVSSGLSGQVGGIAGLNFGPINLTTSSASVSGGDSSYVGGLVGDNGGQVVKSSSFGSVQGGANAYIGGLVGFHAYPQIGSLIQQSFSAANVVGGAGSRTGGLVGWNYDTFVSQSYATGSVSGVSSSYLGGLVGENGGGCWPCAAFIDQTYSTGKVSDGSGQNVGGLVGLDAPPGPFADVGYTSNSYWDSQSSGQPSSSGGSPLTTAELKSGALPGGFDSAVWNASSGSDPSLNWQAASTLVVIKTINDLQNISGNLSGNYVLGANIDASATALWNPGAGFIPIGSSSTPFTGTLDGQGFTISNLTINAPSSTNVGLFGDIGATGIVKNLNLSNESVTGLDTIGGLAAINIGTISEVHATGSVTGSVIQSGGFTSGQTGGLVGFNTGSISDSSSAVSVASGQAVGGLVGNNYGVIQNSHATGSVFGAQDSVGGLVGGTSGTVFQSFATGNVHGAVFDVGGLAGAVAGGGSVISSYSTGTVTGDYQATGGLVGEISSGEIVNSYSTGSVNGNGFVGGLVGKSDAGQITSSYSAGTVSGNLAVGGFIGSSSSTNTNDYWDMDSSGQNAISGGTPEPTSFFKSGSLPPGYSSSVWNAPPGQYPRLNWQPPDATPPSAGGPNFAFPLSGNEPVFLTTMAGGLSSSGKPGTYCGITTGPGALDGYFDPCHQANQAYYSLDFAVASGTDNIVPDGVGTLKVSVCGVTADNVICHVVDVSHPASTVPGALYYYPRIAIDHGNGYFSVFQEFDRTNSASSTLRNVDVQTGDIVNGANLNVAIGQLTAGSNIHLHYQIEYGVDSPQHSLLSIPQLANVTVDGRKIADYKLDGQCGISPAGATYHVTCSNGTVPTEAQILGPTDPKLPLGNGTGAFEFTFKVGSLGVGMSQFLFVDPPVAIGYDFQIISGPWFASLLLPDVGDDQFELYLWDTTSNDWVIDALLHSGSPFDFGPDGVDRFRILGIEPGAGLDPGDPSAFVTGLKFTGAGDVSFTQTPIIENVPEPLTLSFFGAGLAIAVSMRRRRKH